MEHDLNGRRDPRNLSDDALRETMTALQKEMHIVGRALSCPLANDSIDAVRNKVDMWGTTARLVTRYAAAARENLRRLERLRDAAKRISDHRKMVAEQMIENREPLALEAWQPPARVN